MHIKTIKYERTIKLERYLGPDYRYENVTLGCEVELDDEDSIFDSFELAKQSIRDQLKLIVKQAKEAEAKKQEGTK